MNLKKGYQLGANLLKDEKGDVHAHSYCIFNRWKKHLCQLQNAD
jgi:hypothetical protein